MVSACLASKPRGMMGGLHDRISLGATVVMVKVLRLLVVCFKAKRCEEKMRRRQDYKLEWSSTTYGPLERSRRSPSSCQMEERLCWWKEAEQMEVGEGSDLIIRAGRRT